MLMAGVRQPVGGLSRGQIPTTAGPHSGNRCPTIAQGTKIASLRTGGRRHATALHRQCTRTVRNHIRERCRATAQTEVHLRGVLVKLGLKMDLKRLEEGPRFRSSHLFLLDLLKKRKAHLSRPLWTSHGMMNPFKERSLHLAGHRPLTSDENLCLGGRTKGRGLRAT